MKNVLILFCSALFCLSASFKQNAATVQHNGVYSGKIQIEQKGGSATQYHYIVFKADGKADTYVLSNSDLEKVSSLIKNNTPADFSGEYRIDGNDIFYRSSNSINKSEKPAISLFTFYKGKINENGSITLEAMFNDNSKSQTTFTFHNLK